MSSSSQKIVVVDAESNGLLDTVDTIWCVGFYDINTNECTVLQDKDSIIDYLNQIDVIVMHNGISYDIPLFKKVFGYEFDGEIIDTLIMSQVLWPDRPWGHSVDGWGKHLGIQKIENNEWQTFAPIILERCKVDVEIQAEIFKKLWKELEQHNHFCESVKYEL